MPEQKNRYEQLLAQGFSKREIHSVLYKAIMHQLACEKAYNQFTITGKLKWHIKYYLQKVTFFQPLKRLTAKGLYLLKTQFAKKPKNPV